jgi:hypothetical protein
LLSTTEYTKTDTFKIIVTPAKTLFPVETSKMIRDSKSKITICATVNVDQVAMSVAMPKYSS